MTTQSPLAGGFVPLAPSNDALEALYATGHWLYTQQRVANAATVFRAMIQIAPHDERGWLALGGCHEALDQDGIALEMYGVGRVMARPAPRCEIARARVYRRRGMLDEMEAALDEAETIAAESGDDTLRVLLQVEGRRS